MTKNLSLLDNSQIEECLTSNSLRIAVVGIGRIGLPTALCFADSGFQTIGIDINNELVSMINSGDYPLKDEPEFDKIFENVTQQRKLVATTDISKGVSECDVILLSLPTPMDDQNILLVLQMNLVLQLMQLDENLFRILEYDLDLQLSEVIHFL